MLKAILVDDEPNAIKNLKWEIDRYCPEIHIEDTFTNPEEAIAGIDYLKPDCLFLDIEMPQMDGFQLLQELRFKDFQLIITTAYDDHAIKAFKENAIDYLLKPIDVEDLQRAVAKMVKQAEQKVIGFEFDKVIASLSGDSSKKIAIPLAGKTLFVNSDEIVLCKSDGNYTEIHFTDGITEVLSKNLKEVQSQLLSDQFLRVHNSYCINTLHVREYNKADGHYLVMTNSHRVPISRSRREALVQRITN